MPGQVRFVSDATALLSMRSSDFDAYSAFGEVVDNSIQANALNIKVLVTTHTEQRRRVGDYAIVDTIAFGDDGDGMDFKTLHQCLQLGFSSRYNDRLGIGRFGVGMTLGAINQCKKVDVYSKIKGGSWLYTYIDIDDIVSIPARMNEIPEPVEMNVPTEYNSLINDENGTLVIWSKYDKQPVSADELIAEMDIWFGRTYRKFLWGEVDINNKKNKINIEINNKKVLSIDPLHLKNDRFPTDKPSCKVSEIVIDWPIPYDDKNNQWEEEKSKIKIQMALIDESLRGYQGVGNAKETRDRFIDRNEGISILRNGREVFYNEIPHWKPAFEDIDRWWGCEIAFDAVLDKAFMVKNIKRGAVPVTNLKQSINEQIVPTIKYFREQISDHWKKRRIEKFQEKITKQEAEGTTTGHEEAEDIAKKSNTQRPMITSKTQEEASKLASQIKSNESAERQAAWATKFASQPYTIMDESWRSPEFIEIHPLGGADVIKYNLQHPFVEELYRLVEQIQSSNIDQELAMSLKSLIDLLIISYAKSESMFDKNREFKAEKFFEDLKINWGQYLKSYLETWKIENLI
ncbi:MAG: ATP-binding protein [SAR324 cluster bacterium]|nr:ATP-binding protein [SAR324 cluster bacterium]